MTKLTKKIVIIWERFTGLQPKDGINHMLQQWNFEERVSLPFGVWPSASEVGFELRVDCTYVRAIEIAGTVCRWMKERGADARWEIDNRGPREVVEFFKDEERS